MRLMKNPVQKKKVISASRRVEMPGFFPERLVEMLEKRCCPQKVHTLVIWTKSPSNLLTQPRIRECLLRYDQLFMHFTITGMGGSCLEPGIPRMEESLEMLPGLVDFVKDPGRMRIRFDPIVHLRLPGGRSYSNLHHFKRVASAAKSAGIEELVVSWMESYPKVVNRLERQHILIEGLSPTGWNSESSGLFAEASRIGVRISGCCVRGLPVSSCIHGNALSRCHPAGEQASVLKARGQRARCGCTESWDIGWYHPCPGGCLYCYANPAEAGNRIGVEPE
jgi:hypothetical protein